MDAEVRRLAMLLMFQMSMLCTMESFLNDECVMPLWHWQQLYFVTVAAEGFRRVCARRPRCLWAYDRRLG